MRAFIELIFVATTGAFSAGGETKGSANMMPDILARLDFVDMAEIYPVA